MIDASSERRPYLTTFTNEKLKAYGDATPDKGGMGAGFRPHELLEAALATCMNIHLRMYTSNHGLELENVVTKVVLDRSLPTKAVFKYSIELLGSLSEEQKRKLLQIAETCPVRQTLSRTISTQYMDSAGAASVSHN